MADFEDIDFSGTQGPDHGGLPQDEIDRGEERPWEDEDAITSAHTRIPFSGTLYLAGTKYTGLTDASKRWVKVDLVGNTVTETSTPPSNPMPDGEEYYDKTYSYGDIHVTRF